MAGVTGMLGPATHSGPMFAQPAPPEMIHAPLMARLWRAALYRRRARQEDKFRAFGHEGAGRGCGVIRGRWLLVLRAFKRVPGSWPLVIVLLRRVTSMSDIARRAPFYYIMLFGLGAFDFGWRMRFFVALFCVV